MTGIVVPPGAGSNGDPPLLTDDSSAELAELEKQLDIPTDSVPSCIADAPSSQAPNAQPPTSDPRVDELPPLLDLDEEERFDLLPNIPLLCIRTEFSQKPKLHVATYSGRSSWTFQSRLHTMKADSCNTSSTKVWTRVKLEKSFRSSSLISGGGWVRAMLHPPPLSDGEEAEVLLLGRDEQC